MTEGVRPRKLTHWLALAVIAATVWHNPGGSAEVAVTALDWTGTVLGAALSRAGMDGTSDYFTEPTTPDTAPPDATVPAGVEIDSNADRAVVELVELHRLVEAVLPAPPSTDGGES